MTTGTIDEHMARIDRMIFRNTPDYLRHTVVPIVGEKQYLITLVTKHPSDEQDRWHTCTEVITASAFELENTPGQGFVFTTVSKTFIDFTDTGERVFTSVAEFNRLLG